MTAPDLAKFRSAMPKEGRLVLSTHRHPDPDGLGGLVGIQHLLKQAFELESDIVLEGRIRRAENAEMRRLLKIQAVPKGAVDAGLYEGVILVDSQPGFTHTHPPGALPVLAVLDHHEGPEGGGGDQVVPFLWVDTDYGATSTMVYDLIRSFGVKLDQRTATALFCGIRYDTNDLARDVTPNDEVAYLDLQKQADRSMVHAIDQPPLPEHYFRQMGEAIDCCEMYNTLLLTLMGQVTNPESVAEVADWFLRLEGEQWSLAGGACDGCYQVSLRTDMPGKDAYPALRYIVGNEGSCGGHGRMAGGQIPLTDLDLAGVQAMVRARALEVFREDPGSMRLLQPQRDERPA
ncbi:MAG TPA: DHH family phosphoesterase [Planctomycetota bacterium]